MLVPRSHRIRARIAWFVRRRVSRLAGIKKEAITPQTKLIEEVAIAQFVGKSQELWLTVHIYKPLANRIDEITLGYLYADLGVKIGRIIPTDWWEDCPSVQDIIDAAVAALLLFGEEK